MSEEWPFFIKGLKKLAIFALCVTAALAIFNVIGYVSTTYGLIFVTTDGTWEVSSSYYSLRVLSLAFLGFLQAIVAIFLIMGACGFACLIYQGILYLGGYHSAMEKKRRLIAKRPAANPQISKDD
ncbi:hypothetical protein [Pseudomonas amygdali]|uniref:Uncharacterized protein n=1 Tax=Pseudomonas amygdali pv. lachrymans str. M301315 TaxID=629260 RepID=A0AAD0PWR0_PSEAV|nr:hypothetical protein [Pseudomonas amygdali]AXH60147.1 hypothetical protein PLA107_033720 [Pseudomonas amygdali pv. lachrymans str. M301315]RMT05680.1 hypothetical protein ALP54_03990 [Pseudomonas amygdali pv. lachrymans]